MSGQKRTEENPLPRRGVYPLWGSGPDATVLHRPGNSDPDFVGNAAAPGTNGIRALGAAQQRWPTYNRAVLATYAAIGAAAFVAAIIVEGIR